jgi:hypothetical protein
LALSYFDRIQEYLKDKRNWFDVGISGASIGILAFLFVGNEALDNMAEELALVLLAFRSCYCSVISCLVYSILSRYIIVLLRVAMLIKKYDFS